MKVVRGCKAAMEGPIMLLTLGVTHSRVEHHLSDPLKVVAEPIQECLGDQLSLSHRPSILEAFVQEVLHI